MASGFIFTTMLTFAVVSYSTLVLFPADIDVGVTVEIGLMADIYNYSSS